MIARMTEPKFSSYTQPVLSGRPERETPRDRDGQIVCRHKDCENKEVKFRRPCEYNKHMDRHERPYRCTHSACEQNPGFTYSGGLLRHQREVHKMHLSREPLYCPHRNCVRSSGTGFTRRENLEEHLRRRHPEPLDTLTPSSDHMTTSHVLSLPSNRKRIRRTTYTEDEDVDDNDDDNEVEIVGGGGPSAAAVESEETTKRLRVEVAQRDQTIVQLKQELDRLRRLLASLPQVMYHPIPTSSHTGID